MTTKTIRLTEEAYRLLCQRKRPGESFSEVIRRSLGGASVRSLVGLLRDDEGEEFHRGIEERRARRAGRSPGRFDGGA